MRTSNSNNKKPLEVDENSSKKYVYVRSNFELTETVDENGGTSSHWEYDEEKIPKENWKTYKTLMGENRQLQADVLYLSMMTGVDL